MGPSTGATPPHELHHQPVITYHKTSTTPALAAISAKVPSCVLLQQQIIRSFPPQFSYIHILGILYLYIMFSCLGLWTACYCTILRTFGLRIAYTYFTCCIDLCNYAYEHVYMHTCKHIYVSLINLYPYSTSPL